MKATMICLLYEKFENILLDGICYKEPEEIRRMLSLSRDEYNPQIEEIDTIAMIIFTRAQNLNQDSFVKNHFEQLFLHDILQIVEYVLSQFFNIDVRVSYSDSIPFSRSHRNGKKESIKILLYHE